MIRKWQPEDLHLVADALLELKQNATWANELEYDKEELCKWLLHVFTNHMSAVFLHDLGGDIHAIVGVTIIRSYLPPHAAIMEEWCLWGSDAQSVMETWAAAKAWGKTRGAMFAKRSKQEGCREHSKWEKLT